MQRIIDFDRWLFRQINSEWTHSWLDVVLPFTRNEFFWAPFYLFLLLFATINFKKSGWWWSLFFLCSFALTDMISTQIFKDFFERFRPCMDSAASQYVRMLIPCSSSYGFVSSHAANHFGMATFLFLTMRHFGRSWVWLAFVWAALVSYAQLYVGAHFPFDVIGGALLGMLIGTITARLFRRSFGGLIQESADFK